MQGKDYWMSVGIRRVLAACEWRAERDAPLVIRPHRPQYTVADMMGFWTNWAFARWHREAPVRAARAANQIIIPVTFKR